MRHGTCALVLASIVLHVVAGCSSDDGARNTGDGGDSAGSAGASGTTTDDTTAGTAGVAGEASGTAGESGSSADTSGGTAGESGSSAGTSGGSAGEAGTSGGGVGGTGGASGSSGNAGSENAGVGDSGYDQTECPACERGCAAGDPHIITFDGAYYDFQASGEYFLAASGDLVVQVRLEQASACEDVAFVRAVALGSATHRISVHADIERFVRLGDGTSLPFGQLETEFGDWQLSSACDGIVATSVAGDQVIVHLVGEAWLDVEVRPAAASTDLGGLLGDFDGDETNDIALPDGTPLPSPVPWEGLYVAFGGSWSVTEDNSLFVYDSGEAAADYAGGSIPGVVDLATVPENVLADAAAACADVTDPDLFQGCLVDVSCGGVESDAAAAWFISDPEPAVVVAVDEPTTVEICGLTGLDVFPLEDRTVDCPANCAAMGTAWGTDIYTSDSSVCTAAVHAGLIDNNVGGSVAVNPEPGQDAYPGSTRNGVTTLEWGQWDASFSLSR